MPDILMPRLSDSMEEGTVVAWLKADGDEVAVGDEVVEIETDKATMPYESDAAGRLVIKAAEGETLPVGAVIGTVGEPAPAAAGSPESPAPDNVAAAADTPGSSPVTAPESGRDGVSASPIARRAATHLGIEIGAVAGSGAYGRIFKRDVIAHAESTPPSVSEPQATPVAPASPAAGVADPGAADSEMVPLSRIRQIVARRMTEAKSTIPDFTLEVDINMAPLLALRRDLKEVLDPPPSINDLLVKAVGRCLTRHPRVNSTFRGDHLEQFGRVNVGVAVATDQGLVVPTIKDADRRPLSEIVASSRELVERARVGTLTPDDMDGGTITVSNLGMLGIDRFAGVINPPQAAILCVGRTVDRAVAGNNGEIVMAPCLTATLVCDHRVLDGADGARFLADLREIIEQPLTMLT